MKSFLFGMFKMALVLAVIPLFAGFVVLLITYPVFTIYGGCALLLVLGGLLEVCS